MDVVLADSMVAGIDTPTMFIHSRPSRNVFGSLVIREEVSCSRCVAIVVEYGFNKFASCVPS